MFCSNAFNFAGLIIPSQRTDISTWLSKVLAVHTCTRSSFPPTPSRLERQLQPNPWNWHPILPSTLTGKPWQVRIHVYKRCVYGMASFRDPWPWNCGSTQWRTHTHNETHNTNNTKSLKTYLFLGVFFLWKEINKEFEEKTESKFILNNAERLVR